MAQHFAQSAATVSGEFIHHVRFLFQRTFEKMVERGLPAGSGFQTLALPAYISAVTAVEAIVNEMFLADLGALAFGESVLGEFQELLEKLELHRKLVPPVIGGPNDVDHARPEGMVATLEVEVGGVLARADDRALLGGEHRGGLLVLCLTLG